MTAPSAIHPRTRQVIQRVLRDGPWHDEIRQGPASRFGKSFTDAFRDALGSLRVTTCALAAYTAARCEAPLLSTELHEAWGRVTLLWSARELLRESCSPATAHEEAVRAGLADIAMEVVTAANAITRHATDSAAADTAPAAMRLLGAALRRDTRPWHGAPAEPSDSPFLDALLAEMGGRVVRLTGEDAEVATLVRDAVVQADAALRRRAVRPWTSASLSYRVRMAKRALIEAACSLVLPAPGGQVPEGPGAYLWLARKACRVAACAEHVDIWLAPPMIPFGAARAPAVARPVGTTPPSLNSEATVKDIAPGILKTLETDAADAAWRTAGAQFVKLARDPLVAALSRHLGPDDPSFRARIAAFLETELGAALLASLLSLGLAALPATVGEVPQRLSRELRVRALSQAGDLLADLLMGPLREVMSTYLRDVSTELPSTPKGALQEGSTRESAVTASVIAGERELG